MSCFAFFSPSQRTRLVWTSAVTSLPTVRRYSVRTALRRLTLMVHSVHNVNVATLVEISLARTTSSVQWVSLCFVVN